MHYGFWYRFLGIILAFLHISKISKSGKSIGNCTYRYQFGSRHCFLQQWDMHDLRQKSKRGFALVALRNTILQGDGCKWQALWVLPQRSQAAWFSWQSCYREGREKGVVCTWKCGDRAVELYIWCICSGFQCEMYWIPSGLVGWLEPVITKGPEPACSMIIWQICNLVCMRWHLAWLNTREQQGPRLPPKEVLHRKSEQGEEFMFSSGVASSKSEKNFK